MTRAAAMALRGRHGESGESLPRHGRGHHRTVMLMLMICTPVHRASAGSGLTELTGACAAPVRRDCQIAESLSDRSPRARIMRARVIKT